MTQVCDKYSKWFLKNVVGVSVMIVAYMLQLSPVGGEVIFSRFLIRIALNIN